MRDGGGAVILVAFVALALVWAYSRHVFDAYLGLSVPHGAIAPSVDLPIAHTGNGYGKVQADVVPETGPWTGPSGPTGALTYDRPGPLVAGRDGRKPSGLTTSDGYSWADPGPLVAGRAGRASGGLTDQPFAVLRNIRGSLFSPETASPAGKLTGHSVDDLVYRGGPLGYDDLVYRGEPVTMMPLRGLN